MDLTTLGFIIMVALAAVGIDTVLHPKDVILNSSVVGKLPNATIDEKMIDLILQDEVDRVSATPTVMTKARVQLGNQGGLGMALATAANMQAVAYALQAQVGFRSDEIKIAVFTEDNVAKVMITGSGPRRAGAFEQLIEQQKGETVIALMHRAALVGMSRIDPYLTALNLAQRHASDKDFSDVERLITFTKSQFAPTPLNTERALFENLQGIIALFRGNPTDAHSWFQFATKSDPKNAVAVLNRAFADLQLGYFREAGERMDGLLRQMQKTDKILVNTAYMTWGAAQLGLGDADGADRMLAKAITANPDSSTAWALWSDVKRQKGDEAAAEKFQLKSLEASDNFENYAEVAALYFQLAWRDNQPITRNKFSNATPASSN